MTLKINVTKEMNAHAGIAGILLVALVLVRRKPPQGASSFAD